MQHLVGRGCSPYHETFTCQCIGVRGSILYDLSAIHDIIPTENGGNSGDCALNARFAAHSPYFRGKTMTSGMSHASKRTVSFENYNSRAERSLPTLWPHAQMASLLWHPPICYGVVPASLSGLHVPRFRFGTTRFFSHYA